jgi:hypothetical protein
LLILAAAITALGQAIPLLLTIFQSHSLIDSSSFQSEPALSPSGFTCGISSAAGQLLAHPNPIEAPPHYQTPPTPATHLPPQPHKRLPSRSHSAQRSAARCGWRSSGTTQLRVAQNLCDTRYVRG